MKKVEEIKKSIEEFLPKDLKRILAWLSEKGWDEWDHEIKMDSDAGKLCFLVQEAHRAP